MDQFDVAFQFKQCMERFNVESVLPKYAESIIRLVKDLPDPLIEDVFLRASRDYDESFKIPQENWWIKYVSQKIASYNCQTGKFRVIVQDKPTENQVDQFRNWARSQAERFGFEEEKKDSVVKQKEQRYIAYAQLDLVRVDQYNHALYSKWIPRFEAGSLEIHDPKEWLEERTRKKTKERTF